MLTISQLVRFTMAAGMYLLLMWGYLVLPSAQWFAAFLALIMSTMLVFWVAEATVARALQTEGEMPAGSIRSAVGRPGLTMADWQARPEKHPGGDLPVSSQELESAVIKLDSLKSELMLQYAQFGRDQSQMNRGGLGTWHGKRDFHSPS